ncbi:DUF1062 domain-containing protein [Paenibacillus tundrae]|nr:DUF1062 domain-containing protein [Paenibacillus tundrae]
MFDSFYKCTHCDTTWNMSVFSRVNVNSLGQKNVQPYGSKRSGNSMGVCF